MEYEQKIILKNGEEALIRNAAGADGSAVFEVFNEAGNKRKIYAGSESGV